MSITGGGGEAASVLSADRKTMGATLTLRDFIIVAFYNQRIIATVLVASLVLAAAAWIASPSRYTARLQLLVLVGREQSSSSGLNAPSVVSVDGVRATNSEVEFLRDRAVLRNVVTIVGPDVIDPGIGRRRLFWLLPPSAPEVQVEKAVDRLQDWLKVAAPPDSTLVIITYQHKNRDTAILVANTLVQVYLQRRAEIYKNLRSPFLKQKVQSYARQLADIEQEMLVEKQKLDVLNIDQESLLALNRVDSVVQRRESELDRRAGISGEIQATKDNLAKIPGHVFDFEEKTDRVDNDDTDNLLTKLYLDRSRLDKQYQPGDPAVSDVNRQIEVLETLRKKPRRIISIDRSVRNPTFDFLNNHLMQLQVQEAAVNNAVAELDQQIANSQKRVDELRGADKTLQALQRTHQVIDQLYREVSQKAESAEIEEAEAAVKTANVRIVEDADASLHGSSEGLNIALAILAGGVFLAGALTLAAAWNRQVFLLPQEIEGDLGLPDLATFNDGQDFGKGGAAAQIAYLAGQLAVNRAEPSAGVRAIQVVSCGPGEERSAVARFLAMELAGGQNLRTLLLDLTDSDSDQWQSLGKLAPAAPWAGGLVIAPTGVEGLSVSVGATRADISWLRANGETLGTLFATLGTRHDVIVIDAPPAPQSLTAIRLAQVVDGSILVVRAEHSRLPAVRHLCAQLLGAGGDMFGAIMTGRRFHIPKALYRWF